MMDDDIHVQNETAPVPTTSSPMEPQIIKVKPISRVKPTAIAVPQQAQLSPELSESASHDDQNDITKNNNMAQNQVIQELLKQNGIPLEEILGLDLSVVNTLADAFNKIKEALPQLLNNSTNLQNKPQQHDELGQDASSNKSLFKEQLEKQLKERDVMKNIKPVATPTPPPPPPPPPPPLQPSEVVSNNVEATSIESGSGNPEKQDNVPDIRSAMKEELSKAISGGVLTLRKSAPKQKRVVENPMPVDFKQQLKPAARRNLPPLDTQPPSKNVEGDQINPLFEEIKKKNLARRQSLHVSAPEMEASSEPYSLMEEINAARLKKCQNFGTAATSVKKKQEENTPENPILFVKLKRSPLRTIQGNESNKQVSDVGNDKSRFALQFKASLKSVPKPAWCVVNENANGEKTTDNAITEKEHLAKDPKIDEEDKENSPPILNSPEISEQKGNMEEVKTEYGKEKQKENVHLSPEKEFIMVSSNFQLEEQISPVSPLPPTPPETLRKHPPLPAKPNASLEKLEKKVEANISDIDNKLSLQPVEQQQLVPENERGGLLTAIQGFNKKSLRSLETKIESADCSESTTSSSQKHETPEGGRNALLSAIQGFKKDRLKTVSKDESPKRSADIQPDHINISSIMKSALQKRFQACHDEESDEDVIDDSDEGCAAGDDEWEAAEE